MLVVDDNETNRRVIAGQLMHAGYEVSLASGGNEALQLLRQALGDKHPFESCWPIITCKTWTARCSASASTPIRICRARAS